MPPDAKPPSDWADAPLASSAYFISPTETVLQSMGPGGDDISFHDLIEAYNTFSNRIRAQIRGILDSQAPKPALISLKASSHQLAEALRRDLKRIRDEPASHSRRTSFIGGSFQTTEMDEEDIRVSRDLASLSQQVLRFLSDIFSFPALHSIFATNDLRSILSELLAVGRAPSIPSPTSRRTWTLVVWILSVQNLPSEVLSPAKREIVSVLKRALDGEIGKDQAKLDSIKASGQLLKQYPSLFISPLLDIFPCILEHLIADSPVIRLEAVNVLGRFALAKIGNLATANNCHTPLSSTLSTFINSQTTKRKSVQLQLRLRALVKAALSSDQHTHPAEGPFWVIQLLSSFVVLVDHSFFSNPRALKLTLESLQQVAGHKQRPVSTLHPYVWKCLIWVFSRLPVQNGGGDTRDRIFTTIKQDLRGGIGLALILSLLGTAPHDESSDTSDSVSKALAVVRDMLSNKNQLMQVDGIALLTKLLYTPASSAASAGAQNLNILALQLFDGSILHAKRENVISAIRSFGQLSVDQVRQLSDMEILRHWEPLVELWVRASHISLLQQLDTTVLGSPYLSMAEYRQNLLYGWQSLLLMPSDLTQGLAHLTTPDPYPGRIATLICSFIGPTETADAQIQQLVFVRKMWHTLTNVFQPSWLSSPAETVLGAVLKKTYNLAEEQVRDAWAQLCSELLSLGLPSVVGVVRDRREAQMPLEVQRQLWMFAATSIHKSDALVKWSDFAYLLATPLSVWSTTQSEFDMWERLLRASIASAHSDSIPPVLVVEHVFQNVEDYHRISGSFEEVLALLAHVDFNGMNTLPEAIVNAMDAVLCDLYPRQATTLPSLQFIRRLQDIIISSPPTLALPLLLALQNSICKWLEDEEDVLHKDVREEIVQCLFSIPLATIRHLEPSGHNLVSLSRFLATLADAAAFEQFWRVTYHGRDEFYELYPGNIKASLRAFGDIYGGSLAANISQDDSQRDSSCAPDSQPSQPMPSSSFDYYADESKYAFDADMTHLGDTRFIEMEEDPMQEDSASTIRGRSRPSSPIVQVPARSTPPTALDQLQEYWSHIDESSSLNAPSHNSCEEAASVSSAALSFPAPLRSTDSFRVSSSHSKRLGDINDTPARKRRRTDFERSNAIAGPSRRPEQSISESTHMRHSVILSQHAVSQPVASAKRRGKRRLVFDYVAVPTISESRMRYEERSLPTPSPSLRPPPPRQPKPPDPDEEEEDYASWEATLSMAEVKDVQQAFGCESEYLSPDDEESMEVEELTGENQSIQLSIATNDDLPDVIRSPSLVALDHRSQTVPIPPREYHAPPLRRSKTSSARLDALERAYAAVTDDDSQVPVQDLVQASRWVHKIGEALNEQMGRKLDKPR
ncbi:hypothetical protein C8R43DRAFT_1129909 [Mycena crocata]|nr:hypothetical protein C8R43DRAFT_1129909 [Mycena crocata]